MPPRASGDDYNDKDNVMDSPTILGSGDFRYRVIPV